MKASMVEVLLEKAIRGFRPVLLVGAPGVGKTSLTDQVRDRLKCDMLVSHPVVNDPTDAKGMPAIVKGKALFLPFGDLEYVISYKGELLIWLLDDIGQAPPAVQASYMQLLLARRINGHKLPNSVVFVAATNRRGDRAGVSGVLEPVKSRFHMIIELEADAEDLIKWGMKTGKLRKEVCALLRLFPELLIEPPAKDIKPSVCPRVWEFCSQTLDDFDNTEHLFSALCSTIGDGPAAQLYGLMTVFRDLPTVASIKKSPEGAKLPEKPSGFHAMSTVLSKHLGKHPEDVSPIFSYVERMPGDFAVCTIRDTLTIRPELADTEAFQKWNAKNVGLFI
ncbi:MAG: ATP-binding protein [Deltaproteobacteria bacterium]|nr:MAG: ATP-binding protein [Deltaproteobacteria bacterium]RPI56473.1 MAG: ATP-binding protein [Deltaproteobacteria bacterium]